MIELYFCFFFKNKLENTFRKVIAKLINIYDSAKVGHYVNGGQKTVYTWVSMVKRVHCIPYS